MGSRARTKAALVAAGLYAASLLLPAYRSPLRGVNSSCPGWDAFCIGWECATRFDLPGWDFSRVMVCVAWVANPCIWSAVLCLSAGFGRIAAFYAATALVLQLVTALYFRGVVLDQVGFWCWVACSLWLLVACRRDGRGRPPTRSNSATWTA